MKRADLLALIRIAGYHEDQQAGIRLFCENHISRPAFDEAFRAGRAARANGAKCSCPACSKTTTEA